MKKLYKGNIIFTKEMQSFEEHKNSYIVVNDGVVEGIFQTLPEEYKNLEVTDFGNSMIIPGFNDLHVHAPQWLNMGIGYSEELLPWLEKYTFPLESAFADADFARVNYQRFIDDMVNCGTTRACIFATRHLEATQILIDLLKEKGIGAYVGKVNMDRNSSAALQEDTQDSINETLILAKQDMEYARLAAENGKAPLVRYILTPRFVPSTTPELMKALSEIAHEYDLPVQSHLDENKSEIAWVKELHPECESFTAVYKDYGLIMPNKTIMAHCVHNNDAEIKILKDEGVFVAHCPQSNMNLTSGIMPLRRYLDLGINVGLGSDVSGGHTVNMAAHITETINSSKAYHSFFPEYEPLSTSEAFYIATKGSGSFFGKVGSFEVGYDFDALVIDDTDLLYGQSYETLQERLEKYIYTGTPNNIKHRYVRGNEISNNFSK